MKNYFFIFSIALLCFEYGSAQIVCVRCYDQNDSISSGVQNLLSNGSFESSSCTHGLVFCPNSSNYACNISNWICTGGGPGTYANLFDTTQTAVANGTKAPYFGNYYGKACSTIPHDTSCLRDSLCYVKGIPLGYPQSFAPNGGATGVSLEQTVNGLIPGNIYILEFWAGGEVFQIYFPNSGIFAVDVGYGNIFLRCKPTYLSDTGTTYIIEFYAISTSHTIKFTNWGHICLQCTELILDNVRLYTLQELSPAIPACQPLQAPIVNFISNYGFFCGSDSIDFYDLSINNPVSWHWYFPGAIPNSSFVQNPTGIFYATTGTFPVTLVSCNGVGCDSLTYSAIITGISQPNPPIVSVQNDTLCVTQSVSYSWFDMSNPANILSISRCFVPIVSGAYAVTIVDSNGCNATSSSIDVITTIANRGINHYSRVDFNQETNELKITSSNADESEITVYDISSRILLKQKFVNSTSINMKLYASGIYLFELRNKTTSISKGKFVKK